MPTVPKGILKRTAEKVKVTVEPLVKDWKTSLVGVAITIAVGLYLWSKITTEQFLAVTSFLTGLGFLASKDSNKKEE